MSHVDTPQVNSKEYYSSEFDYLVERDHPLRRRSIRSQGSEALAGRGVVDPRNG
jgi:hypothetical protein